MNDTNAYIVTRAIEIDYPGRSHHSPILHPKCLCVVFMPGYALLDTFLGPIVAQTFADTHECIEPVAIRRIEVSCDSRLLIRIEASRKTALEIKYISYLETKRIQRWIAGTDPSLSDLDVLSRRRLIEKLVFDWIQANFGNRTNIKFETKCHG